jgi:plasmid maintenance system antidote protein VapI
MSKRDDLQLRALVEALTSAVNVSNLSRNALDQDLGLPPGTLSKLLTGKLELKAKHILRICPAIGIHPGQLFYLAEQNLRGLGTLGTVERVNELRIANEQNRSAAPSVRELSKRSRATSPIAAEDEDATDSREELRALIREEMLAILAEHRSELATMPAAAVKKSRAQKPRKRS